MRAQTVHGRNSQSAFTLVEVLVVTVVIAMVIGFAVPAMGRWIDDVRHRALVTSYHEAFSYARWQAVTERYVVTICPLTEAGECTDDWNQEVSVFPDADSNRQPDLGTIWRVLSPPPASFDVRSRTDDRGYLQFAPDGFVHGPSGSLVVCPRTSARGGRMSYLGVNRGGRFRAEHAPHGERTMRLSWGAVLNC